MRVFNRRLPTSTPQVTAFTLARRVAKLLLGLALLGVGIALMLQSNLGLGPWDMFHQGLSHQLPISVGVASQLVGLIILGLLLLVRVRFGIGTILNIFLIGLIIDLTRPHIPELHWLPSQLGVFLLAIGLCGLGTGLYIGANLGAGPRDSFMLWVHQRTGWSVRAVRTATELCVLLCGWLLGGKAGVGTLLFAFGIGPAVQLSLALFHRPTAAQAELAEAN